MTVLRVGALLNPNVCFLCEMSNDVRFFDTGREFDPPSFSSLVGRKYVCESCVKTAAEALGLFEEPRAAVAQDVRDMSARIVELQDRADLVESMRELAVVLAPLVEPSDKPLIELQEKTIAGLRENLSLALKEIEAHKSEPKAKRVAKTEKA